MTETIHHPMYDDLISGYNPQFYVSQEVKQEIIDRIPGLDVRDRESIFLLIVTHHNKHPIKTTFLSDNQIPYGGKQLKKNICLTFEMERLPDQLVYVIYRFLLKMDEQKEEDQIDQQNNEQPPDEMNYDTEYTNIDHGYASLSVSENVD